MKTAVSRENDTAVFAMFKHFVKVSFFDKSELIF